MRKLYSYFGINLTMETESSWKRYLDNDPIKTKYGKHKYTMEQFNLTREELAQEFEEYIDIMSKRADAKDILWYNLVWTINLYGVLSYGITTK